MPCSDAAADHAGVHAARAQRRHRVLAHLEAVDAIDGDGDVARQLFSGFGDPVRIDLKGGRQDILGRFEIVGHPHVDHCYSAAAFKHVLQVLHRNRR